MNIDDPCPTDPHGVGPPPPRPEFRRRDGAARAHFDPATQPPFGNGELSGIQEPPTQRFRSPDPQATNRRHAPRPFGSAGPPPPMDEPTTQQFSDPHAEFRRQATEHFRTQPPTSPKRVPWPGADAPSDGRTQRFSAPGAQSRDVNQPPPPIDSWPTTTGGAVRFDLKPWHLLWALAAISVVVAVISSSTLSWIFLAAVSAAAGWYTYSRRTAWPTDIRDQLIRHRLAASSSTTSASPNASTPQQAASSARIASTPPVPFRAMTIPELFAGAVKIVVRNWPTLMGIPVGILLAFIAFIYVAVEALVHFMLDTSSALNGGSLFGSGDASSFISGMTILMIVFVLVCAAVALPADALLLALSVMATVRSVRGQPVRLADMFRQARPRIFAVCRMTLVFYLIAFLPDIAVITVFSLGGLAVYFNGVALTVFWMATIATFVLSILFSLSPIVLIVEGRGVMDSLRRSVRISRPAWGRLIGIHLLWVACMAPVVFVTLVVGSNVVLYAVIGGCLLACFRVLQVLIYTDLRIRQEHYEQELIADWTRQTGYHPL
jgi:hypothetical protein